VQRNGAGVVTLKRCRVYLLLSRVLPDGFRLSGKPVTQHLIIVLNGVPRMTLQNSAGMSQRGEEVLEGRPVLSRRNQGRFFMAIAVDLEKVFRRAGCVVDFLPELEGQDWVLGAVDDEDGRGDFFQIGLRVELGVNEQA
jgi:hypothetical protein